MWLPSRPCAWRRSRTNISWSLYVGIVMLMLSFLAFVPFLGAERLGF
jgi:hypothetical protein